MERVAANRVRQAFTEADLVIQEGGPTWPP